MGIRLSAGRNAAEEVGIAAGSTCDFVGLILGDLDLLKRRFIGRLFLCGRADDELVVWLDAAVMFDGVDAAVKAVL